MKPESSTGLSRRGILGASLLVAVAAGGDAVARAAPATAFELALRPTRVFKTADRSHERTESWIFSLAVQTATTAPLTPAGIKIELLKAGAVVQTTAYSAAGMQSLTYRSTLPAMPADGAASPTPIYWPFIVRLRQMQPITMGVDAQRIEITCADAAGKRHTNAITVPIETYQQKTQLIFPFRGKAIILQGGATNGGHRNRSGAFALDACGLDDAWSIVAPGDGKANSDYRGWGRLLIAPAAGVVVFARNDRPDQPVGDQSNPAFFAPEFQKLGGGDPGNHLVVDHGSGEFSLIAHFQAGSMLVMLGDRVAQGQALGKLGHSGDTDAPHVHYQLQSGPDINYADGFPCKFTNVSESFLDRGTYFEAK